MSPAFPPCLYINQVIDGLKGKSISVGAQNSAVESMQGALTGQTSRRVSWRTQVVPCACRALRMLPYNGRVRRDAESQFAAAQACGLIPVLCIGGNP
ncbi:triose-phosphate isomerase [Pseudomonas sp. GNP014]